MYDKCKNLYPYFCSLSFEAKTAFKTKDQNILSVIRLVLFSQFVYNRQKIH